MGCDRCPCTELPYVEWARSGAMEQGIGHEFSGWVHVWVWCATLEQNIMPWQHYVSHQGTRGLYLCLTMGEEGRAFANVCFGCDVLHRVNTWEVHLCLSHLSRMCIMARVVIF